MHAALVIDCFPESLNRYQKGYAVVAVDVIRASTTAVTAVAMGGRCFPVPSVEAALGLAARLDHALLAGEVGGKIPPEFDMNNSPAELAGRTDILRPLILLSSSGTQLIHSAGECEVAYLACFRSWASLACYLVDHPSSVALIAARTRGEFRKEDQTCCAWIAEELMKAGYRAENRETVEIRRAVPRHTAWGLRARQERRLPATKRPGERPGVHSRPHARSSCRLCAPAERGLYGSWRWRRSRGRSAAA